MAGPVVIEFHSVPFLKSSTFRLSVGSLRLSFAHLFVLKITSCHFVDLTRYQSSNKRRDEGATSSLNWVVGSACALTSLSLTNRYLGSQLLLNQVRRTKAPCDPTKAALCPDGICQLHPRLCVCCQPAAPMLRKPQTGTGRTSSPWLGYLQAGCWRQKVAL